MFVVAGGASPGERPKRHEEEGGSTESLRGDAGLPSRGQGATGQKKHLREDAGLGDQEQREDKGLIDRAKDKLKGQ